MELRFRVPAEEEMERPPTQRDQFDNDDVELVDALVRESIQNSLDAKTSGAGDPVRVRIRILELQGEQVAEANTVLNPMLVSEHLRACGIPPIDLAAPMRVLVVEDFGTSGLTGSWSEWDQLPFCDFWRRMGRSHKKGQALGRWGLGKLVFSSASKARVFFGLTRRADESHGLLMGQAVLTTHELNGVRQDSHGFYAAAGAGIQLPVSDTEHIKNFCRIFGVSRRQEPGLSVVVPYLRDSISESRIVKGVLRNYFFPILYGRLIVKVGEVEIDEASFEALTAELDPTHFAGVEFATFIKVIKDSRSASAASPLTLPIDWRSQTTLDAHLGADLERLRSSLNDGEVVAIRAPVLLKRKDGRELTTFVDAFLQRALADMPALVVRGSIVLNAESKYFRGRKVFAALIADDPAISEFLGDAENPAHTGWSASAEKVSSSWRAARERLAEVRALLQKVHNALVSAVESLDKDALVQLFSIPSEDGSRTEKNVGERLNPRHLPQIPSNPRSFHVSELADGFRVRAGTISEESLPFGIRVRIAYDVLRGNPFSKHDPADFDIRSKQLQFLGRGVTIKPLGPATLQIDVESADFCLDVRGFDRNRDLIVDSERFE